MNETETPPGWRLSQPREDMIFQVCYGSWDDRTARGFLEEFNRLLPKLREIPWGLISDVTHWHMPQESTKQLIMRHHRTIAENGCKALGYFSGPGSLRWLELYRLIPTDLPKDFFYRVNSQRNKVIEELHGAGFPLEEQQLSTFFREDIHR